MKTIVKPLTFESVILEIFLATDKPVEGKPQTTRDISPWYDKNSDGKYLYFVGTVSVEHTEKIQSMVEEFMKGEDK